MVKAIDAFFFLTCSLYASQVHWVFEVPSGLLGLLSSPSEYYPPRAHICRLKQFYGLLRQWYRREPNFIGLTIPINSLQLHCNT
ncbi:hypothetical protein DER45DRAFT_562005 [Fusarium avenaceum]|nr:hypothetical protein DER45DRAFT_562005 [Fusarium avenaceum]